MQKNWIYLKRNLENAMSNSNTLINISIIENSSSNIESQPVWTILTSMALTAMSIESFPVDLRRPRLCSLHHSSLGKAIHYKEAAQPRLKLPLLRPLLTQFMLQQRPTATERLLSAVQAVPKDSRLQQPPLPRPRQLQRQLMTKTPTAAVQI